jgi:SAM-dependent methyltransferase
MNFLKNLQPFTNPFQGIKARNFALDSLKFDKSYYDLELFLYSKILTNNMLHYGYFEDIHIQPETISFERFEEAQIAYAENIIEQIQDKDHPILDVGCGMGGFSELLSKSQCEVEALTPNKNQIEFIRRHYAHIVTHHCNYEQFDSIRRFGAIINSESLQYISLNEAFEKSSKILMPGGRWIIIDYFSLEKKAENQKPHHLDTFYLKAKEFGWRITYNRDITLNILPTLAYVAMYVNRFLLPLKQFAYEKLRYKQPKLYYLSQRLRAFIDRAMVKQVNVVDPIAFKSNRKYMLFVLEKE